MPGVATGRRICRCVWSPGTLAADAASSRPGLRAADHVLFGGWGRTHTLRAGRPSSSVSNTAPLPAPHPDWTSARGTGSQPALRAACTVTGFRFEAGRLVFVRVGFLCFAPSAAYLAPTARAAVPEPSCAWARTSPWTGLRGFRLPRRCGNPLVSVRRTPPCTIDGAVLMVATQSRRRPRSLVR